MTDDDPFDDIDADAHREREGDPFDGLGSDANAGPTAESESAGAEAGDQSDTSTDPFEYLGADEADRAAGGDESQGHDGGSPPGNESVDVATDLFSGVDVSRGDPFESADTPFERETVDGADPDEVWERLTADADSAETTAQTASEDVVEVSKHSFCERCPHFSSPPDVECGHEGTNILEFVGTEQVRVADCPVVRERRELGEIHD